MINGQFEEKGNWLQHLITKLIILNPPPFEKSDYESVIDYRNKLIFIEKNNNSQSPDNYIPCLFYRNPNSSNFLIYFHGNSEHIFQIEFYGLDFRSYLDMNIIIVEYPGYSIYPCDDPDSNIFFTNALIIYDWIKTKFNITDEQIFVCGRSLGTASAIFLSSLRKPKALFLISAFTSLKNIGKDFWVSYFIEGVFNSYRYISNISCPTLFIHGKKDSLINYHHSEQLKEEINKINQFAELKLNENMTHNDFNLKEDIIFPIKDFINGLENIGKINFFSGEEINDLFKIPQPILKLVESKLFDINNFQFHKKIPIKNSKFFQKIDNNIILTSDSKILMYNQKNYSLEEEIDINKNHPGSVINSLVEISNKNFVCGTNLGDIIIFEKVLELEEDNFEDLDNSYKEIKCISLKEEIYKIDKIKPNYICVLTKNALKFYDDNFNEKNSIILVQLYTNFVQTSQENLALLSYNHLSIYKIMENKIEIIHRYNNIISNIFNNILLITNKYIIVGGRKYLYFFFKDNYSSAKKRVEAEINYIYKINDEFFLASTNDGLILSISINEKYNISIKHRKLIDGDINSLFVKNIKSFLITNENNIQIWTTQSKESKDEACLIF